MSIPAQPLKLNGFFLDPNTNALLNADDGRWDFPTLMIEATSSIEFYNAGQRTMHKIEIVDNSGINQVLTSDQRRTPISKGLFQSLKVCVTVTVGLHGSAHENTEASHRKQVQPSLHRPVIADLRSLYQQTTHQS